MFRQPVLLVPIDPDRYPSTSLSSVKLFIFSIEVMIAVCSAIGVDTPVAPALILGYPTNFCTIVESPEVDDPLDLALWLAVVRVLTTNPFLLLNSICSNCLARLLC